MPKPATSTGSAELPEPAEPADEWLTPAEARALFPNIGETTLKRWGDQGLLGECRRTLGGHRRYRASAVRRAAEADTPHDQIPVPHRGALWARVNGDIATGRGASSAVNGDRPYVGADWSHPDDAEAPRSGWQRAAAAS